MNKLKNKSYKDYSYTSRYAPFPYYYNSEDTKYVYGVTANLDNTTVYTQHTVSRGDTLDSLALKYYNNPTLYWIICSFNRIQDPYTELVEGQKINIPSISALEFDYNGRS